jgi:hypothetical protein
MKSEMMRLCVFCGKKPSAKNREHIIPKWLMALTGASNYKARFGIDKNTGKPREFTYSSFAFPACESCNTAFARLESIAQQVMIKLLRSEPLSKSDFYILLDWFDKVRVGLWLAFYFLDKNIGGITPKFHIESRIGLHDRMLQIIKVAGRNKELSFRGCDMPSFYYTPECFSMIIDNYCFINISSPFLISQSVGFPYSRRSYLRTDGLADYAIEAGSSVISECLLPGWLQFRGTLICQPMFRWLPQISTHRIFYENEHVKTNSLDFEHGMGEIFIEKEGHAFVLPSDASSDWIPYKEYDRQAMNPDISIHTIQLQLSVDNLQPSYENLSPDDQAWWRKMLKTNQDYADRIISILRENSKI